MSKKYYIKYGEVDKTGNGLDVIPFIMSKKYIKKIL